MLLLVVLILLTLLQVSLSTKFLFEQFKGAMENHKEFFVTCPGSVIIIDEIFETRYYQPTQNRDNLFDPTLIHIISRCPKLQFFATQDLRMCLSYSLFSERNLFFMILVIDIKLIIYVG